MAIIVKTTILIALFNGHNLDGWQGDAAVFRVQDGAIVAGSMDHPIAQNEFLCTTKEYENFELRLKFKLLGGQKSNGGVQFRSQRMAKDSDKPNEMIGYQADIAEGYWGCLYDESRRKRILAGPSEAERKAMVKPDEWNDYRIVCEGRRIRLWLNGRQTVDYTEKDASIPQKGLIAVQIHGGPPAEAWYKDIEIRVLP